MKRKILLFVALVCATMTYAQAPKVGVTNDIGTYTGTMDKVYDSSKGYWYARNTKGEYERYGIYEKVNTLALASGTYQDIKYIETTTDMETIPYINTKYVRTANSRIVMKCNLTQNTDRNYEALFGDKLGGNWGWDGFAGAKIAYMRWGGDNTDNGCYNCCAVETQGGTALPFGKDVTIDCDGQTMNVFDGIQGGTTVLNSITNTGTAEAVASTIPMFIFDSNKGTVGSPVPDNSRSFMKLYEFQVYEGEDLKMDLVPIVASSGKVGLRDKIAGGMYYSANDGTFTGSDAYQGQTGITAYEGKLVILQTDGHEYQYTNGSWVDKGVPTVEEIKLGEGEPNYKDMTKWTFTDGKGMGEGAPFHYLTYTADDNSNVIDPYAGVGGWEPCGVPVTTEPGVTYNWSFNFTCEPWDTWNTGHYMKAMALDTWEDGMVEYGDDLGGDHGVLSRYQLPHVATDNLAVSFDFTADKTKTYLVLQFGLVADGNNNYFFQFSNILVKKYVNPVTYEFLEAPKFNPVYNSADEIAKDPLLYEGMYAYLPYQGDFSTYQLGATGGFTKVVDRPSLPYKGQTATAGNKYYLYQVDCKKNAWLGDNYNDPDEWTTYAQLGEFGFDVTLNDAGNGQYLIYPMFRNGYNIRPSSPYMDTGDKTPYTLTPVVVNGVTAYLLKSGDYTLGSDGNELITNTADKYSLWQLVSKEDRLADLSKATTDNPVDATWLIASPNYPSNDLRYIDNTAESGWVHEADGNGGAANGHGVPCSYCFEFWNTTYNTMTQTITGLPAGNYSLTVQGFYRDGNQPADAAAKVAAGTETLRQQYFANDAFGYLSSIVTKGQDTENDDQGFTTQAGDMQKFVPNSLSDASKCFYYGYYMNAPIVFKVTDDGTAVIGVKKSTDAGDTEVGDGGANHGNWTVFSRWRMKYHGNGAIPTGINGVKDNVENATNNVIYTISGVRMNKNLKALPKGVYIVNGKKVLVK